jgi:hypothetical protein
MSATTRPVGGASAPTLFRTVQKCVGAHAPPTHAGASAPDQITWLPRERWLERPY